MQMPPERLKERFGDEYPAVVTLNGVRMHLTHEGRFSRSYRSEDGKIGASMSRFMDGSAAITFAELQNEWPQWSDFERAEFCGSCGWMGGQLDFPDILRFIMQQGSEMSRNMVVLKVARHLPQDEAFQLLLDELRQAQGNHTANITQAIAATGHADAPRALREHLDALWSDPRLWEDDPFINYRAFDTTCCIANLLELGAPPQEFEERVRLLSAHPCQDNRDSCSRFLHQHYGWLTTPNPRPFGA